MKHAQDDMVWIDSKGVVHPLGETAAERMHQREGAFRLMPGPKHVVFMRFTGEDGRRDVEDGAVVRLAGEITALGMMCEILALIGQTGWKGQLLVQDGNQERSVFFNAGEVLYADSTVEWERMGSILYRFGKISQEQQILIQKKSVLGISDISTAMQMGFLQPQEVELFVRRQIMEIVFGIIQTSGGVFYFLDDFASESLAFQSSIQASPLIMESVVRLDEAHQFQAWIPTLDYLPEKACEKTDDPQEWRSLWDAMDGHTSIFELGRKLHIGDFAALKGVIELQQQKHVHIHPPRDVDVHQEILKRANAILQSMYQRVDGVGRGTLVRRTVDCSMDEVQKKLWHNAGPYEDGSFNVQVILENAKALSNEMADEQFFMNSVIAYIAKLLLAVEEHLGRQWRDSLESELNLHLQSLQQMISLSTKAVPPPRCA